MKISTPLSSKDIENIKVGQWVYMSGIIYTARDAAHKRIIEALEKSEALPFDLDGNVIYYTGPTPTPPGKNVGSCGPTTSYRMDCFSTELYKKGIKATIGKGERDTSIAEACKKYNAVYLIAIGGAGAYLSQFIQSSSMIAYEDLGPEAVYKLEVKDFPTIVGIDSTGNTVY